MAPRERPRLSLGFVNAIRERSHLALITDLRPGVTLERRYSAMRASAADVPALLAFLEARGQLEPFDPPADYTDQPIPEPWAAGL